MNMPTNIRDTKKSDFHATVARFAFLGAMVTYSIDLILRRQTFFFLLLLGWAILSQLRAIMWRMR